MKDGLSRWMAEMGYRSIEAFSGRAVANTTDWKHLDMNFRTIAHIDQESCIQCGRCYIACEDTSLQSIAKGPFGKSIKNKPILGSYTSSHHADSEGA